MQLGNKLLFGQNCGKNFLLLISLVKHDLALKSSKAVLITTQKYWLKQYGKLFICDKILQSSRQLRLYQKQVPLNVRLHLRFLLI